MALSLVESKFTYQSSAGGETYLFEIVIDQQGLLAIRNIRTPLGLIADSISQVPEIVAQDMLAAMDIVRLIVDESSVTGGVVTFSGQTTRSVVLPNGILNNVNYRVQLLSPDGTPLKVTTKTVSGFVIEAATTYGTQAAPLDVCWDVFVSTAQASTFGGVLSFAPGVVSRAVVFPSASPTADYRVLLEPSDFFLAKVTGQTKLGFSVVLGHDPTPNTVTVGYDVVA